MKEEYMICLIFVGIMFLIIAFLTEFRFWTAIAFLVGAFVSIICGIIGMLIATRTNYKVTYLAKDSLTLAFETAYRAGCSMGFMLVSIGLLVLTMLIVIYKRMMNIDNSSSDSEYFRPLF